MTWVLDRARSEVLFSVRQLVVSMVSGRFHDFDATISLDTAHPEQSTVTAVMKVASLHTGNALRDRHLRSSAFFDAARFPHITFSSTHVGQVGADSFWLGGDLTIHGVTREVTLRGRFAEPIAALAERAEVRFSMETELDRKDFGLDWDAPLDGGGVVVGRLVRITINATLVRAEGTSAPSMAAVQPVAAR